MIDEPIRTLDDRLDQVDHDAIGTLWHHMHNLMTVSKGNLDIITMGQVVSPEINREIRWLSVLSETLSGYTTNGNYVPEKVAGTTEDKRVAQIWSGFYSGIKSLMEYSLEKARMIKEKLESIDYFRNDKIKGWFNIAFKGIERTAQFLEYIKRGAPYAPQDGVIPILGWDTFNK